MEKSVIKAIDSPDDSDNRQGAIAAIVACLFTALMGLFFYRAHTIEPQVSSISGSFLRVLGNLIILLPWLIAKPRRLFQIDHSRDLWLWGLFGALTVLTYFYAVETEGCSLTNVLNSGSGVIVILVAPLLLRQRPHWFHWLSLGGAVVGTILITPHPTHAGGMSTGFISGLVSGVFAALAFLMVARARKGSAAETILLVWFQTNIVTHLVLISMTPARWPHQGETWICYLGAGLLAALAQRYQALAYRKTNAASAAGLSYLTPVFSLTLDFIVFGITPSSQLLWGAATIVLSGTVAFFGKV